MAVTADVLGPTDREQIAEQGATVDEVLRQLALFATPPAPTVLDRPCTRGDGLRVLGDADVARYATVHREAAAAGRFVKFVPASGAASRMFKAELWALDRRDAARRSEAVRLAEGGDADARDLLAFMDGIERFAFFPDLCAVLAARGLDAAGLAAAGEFEAILAAMLERSGLDFAARPKGLIPFHRYPEGGRTAFEEHLVEAAGYTRDRHGVCRLHFTISPQHLDTFRVLLDRVRAALERRLDARLVVDFSFQRRGTDTVAAGEDDRPFRTRDGRLLFRPGGHGALLGNLGDLGADLVYVKNIDNVVPERLLEPTILWKAALGGLLVATQERAFGILRALDAGAVPSSLLEDALDFVEHDLLVPVPPDVASGGRDARSTFLRERLDRPLRVCGMVRNLGDPGGGPFWVRGRDGRVTPQIVETAQVDAADPKQRAILAAATHFNPVDLVCGLRDWRGHPFPLACFVDTDAVFLSRKSHEGRVLKALEHPGLWNGSMAGWNTIFVEVPSIMFNPAKTVNDLLRPEHQPA